MKKIIILLSFITLASSLLFTPAYASSVDDSTFNPICEDLDDEQKALVGCGNVKKDDFTKTIEQIINVAITVVGIAAVSVIVFAGQRYITSAGDASKAKQAKDMIMYAVIGLIIAILSWAIISFVVNNVK